MLDYLQGILLSYGYPGLFIASFLASTIIPFGSEWIVTLLVLGGFNVFTVILVASVGNFLGACTSYYIGLKGRGYAVKYLRIKPVDIERAEVYFSKYGTYVLLFTWLPIIGDAITVAGGLLRLRFITFAIFVFIGKFVRYLIWAYLPVAPLLKMIFMPTNV